MCKAVPEKPVNLPWLVNAWRSVYLALPNIYFPGTSMDISFTLFSAAFLMALRYLYIWTFLNIFKFDDWTANEASGSMGAAVHATMLVPGLVVGFLTRKYNPCEHRREAPQWWVDFIDSLLQFCSGYMVYDAIFICIVRMEPGSFLPQIRADDLMYIGHHFTTLVYMTQNRYYEAGHMSAMICMLLGEVTNPLQNGYYISELAMNIDKGNAAVHWALETAFGFGYILVRVVIAPIVFLHLSYDLLFSKNGKANLPLAIRCFWVFMIWLIEAGSIPWVVDCYGKLQVNLGLTEAPMAQEL